MKRISILLIPLILLVVLGVVMIAEGPRNLSTPGVIESLRLVD